MRCHYQKKTKQTSRGVRRYGLGALAVLLIGAGAYVLLIVFAPQLNGPGFVKTWNAPVPQANLTENRLYIPKLKLNLSYKDGDETVLHDNIWHRFPERGDPEKGGNFILAGHRFEIGLTPGETARKSPFYHIDTLVQGDKIYADFNGKRYAYEVTEKYTVKPSQTEIEAISDTPKLTLYTCTFQGSADGREVIIATLVGRDISPASQL